MKPEGLLAETVNEKKQRNEERKTKRKKRNWYRTEEQRGCGRRCTYASEY